MATLASIKVLLVEDEPLVAMGVADQLIEAGATIVGPCPTTRRAIDTLQSAEVDVAVILSKPIAADLLCSTVAARCDRRWRSNVCGVQSSQSK